MPEHTPVPWVADTDTLGNLGVYGGEHGYRVACGGLKADIDLIVRAVNSHDALVSACRKVLDIIKHDDPDDVTLWKISREIESAIATIKENQ